MPVGDPARQDRARELRLGGMYFHDIAQSSWHDGSRLYASAGAARNGYLAAERRAQGAEPADVADDDATYGAVPLPEHDPADWRTWTNGARMQLVEQFMTKALTDGDVDAAHFVERVITGIARTNGANKRPAPASAEGAGLGGDPIDELAERREQRRGTGGT